MRVTGKKAVKSTAGSDSFWEVVGGADLGGIGAREEVDLSSQEIGVNNEDLTGLSVSTLHSIIEDAGELCTGCVDKADLVAKSREVKRADSNPHGHDAFHGYRERFNDKGHIFNRKALPWDRRTVAEEEKLSLPINEELRAELEQDMGVKLEPDMDQEILEPTEPSTARWDWTKRASREKLGERSVMLCAQCRLPLGDIVYTVRDAGLLRMHGECMAQHLLNDLKKDDKADKVAQAALKRSRRREYNIGWKYSFPRNLCAAEKMGCNFTPKGMCCVMLQSNSNVSVVPTLEPAGAVNLVYLSLALKVRREEGREPLFSLDPVDEKKDSMQFKRFEPEWLAGTPVGDVLFQSDYHLKELSMGEYKQPVVGMRSCSDIGFDNFEVGWMAREWFMVRKAEIHVSQDHVIMPFVRMGVEAWEQIVGEDGKLQDAKVTRSDHPLLKYAQAFTHNFDLIAERKSVIFYLRELAKASVLAKYLVDAQVSVPKGWFSVTPTPNAGPNPKSLEIPQLWNERHIGKIKLQDGTIVDGEKGVETMKQGVYGGVDFGLDRFSVARPGRGPKSLLEGRVGLGTHRAVSPSSMIGVRPGEARGVDLNLDKFDLSSATMIRDQATAVKLGDKACGAVGEFFWSNVDSSVGSAFKDEEKILLKNLFNPFMSDRREEQDQFVPPDTSCAYLNRLNKLMKEEDACRESRMNHFFSKQFVASNPGPLFPSSWKDYLEIERIKAASGPPLEDTLHERPDYKDQAHMFEHILKSVIPVFDQTSEEGIRWRVYKVGSIEVRTTQKLNEIEVVGAVFSTRPVPQSTVSGKQGQEVKDHELLAKVTMYVEKDPRRQSQHQYYLVLETDPYYLGAEDGNTVVTEMLSDGTVTWKENPADLEDRNSLAKAFSCKDCRGKGVIVDDVKCYQADTSKKGGTLQNDSRRYAIGAYDSALGEVICVSPFTTTAKVPESLRYANVLRTLA